MTATWCFHSYKGGTGKTMTSLNTAVSLTLRGHKVCLLDFDLLGPAMFAIFGEKDKYLNDAFYNDIPIEECILPINNPKFNVNGGSLFVGLADPQPDHIMQIYQKTDDDHREAVANIMDMQDYIEDDLEIDYIIIDNGPGMNRMVMNAMLISENIAIVLKPTKADVEGTKLLVNHMLKGQEKFLGIVMNRTLDQSWQDHAAIQSADIEYADVTSDLELFTAQEDVKVLSRLPCYCDIARSQSDKIIVLDHPEHPFCQSIDRLVSAMTKQ